MEDYMNNLREILIMFVRKKHCIFCVGNTAIDPYE